MRELSYFLELEVGKNTNGITLSQRQNTLQLLEDANNLGCKTQCLPMNLNLQLNDQEEEHLIDPTKYKHIIHHFLYLTITIPDITFPIHKLSQFVAQLCTSHLTIAYNILRYLKGTPLARNIVFTQIQSPTKNILQFKLRFMLNNSEISHLLFYIPSQLPHILEGQEISRCFALLN